MSMGKDYVLTLACPDKPGIVNALSSFPAHRPAHIPASQQRGESPDGLFFMRVHFCVPPLGVRFGEGPRLAELERGLRDGATSDRQGTSLVGMEAAHA